MTTYNAPKPPLPPAPQGLRVTRTATGATVSWRATRSAPVGGYLVTVTVADGRHWSQHVRRAGPLRVVVGKLGFGRWRVAAAVAGIDAAGRAGRPAKAQAVIVRKAPKALTHL